MTALTSHVHNAFAHSLRVRYLEVDQQGVVFNMWYLGFVDDTLDAFLADRGLSLTRLSELGFDISLAHTEVDWSAPLRHGDEVDVLMSTARLGDKSFTLDFAFRRGTEFTCSGCIIYVPFDITGDGGSIPLPRPLRDALGEPAPLREK